MPHCVRSISRSDWRGAVPSHVFYEARKAGAPLESERAPWLMAVGLGAVAALSLEGVCISHTAACQARRSEASPVVRAAYPEAPERAVGAPWARRGGACRSV